MGLVNKHEAAGQSAFHQARSIRVDVGQREVKRCPEGIGIDPDYTPHIVETHFIDSTRLPPGSNRTSAAKATQWVRPD